MQWIANKRKKLAGKQNLRTDVINVARQLFMSKGYENVGMRDIAQVLGQQPTQVYRLNLCKADILAELILELNEKTDEQNQLTYFLNYFFYY